MSRFVELLEERCLFSHAEVARTSVFWPGRPDGIFKAGQNVTVGVKVIDPGHTYASRVDVAVREQSSGSPNGVLPDDAFDDSWTLKHNVAYFHFTVTTAGPYRVEVSLPDLPANPRALPGGWSSSFGFMTIKPAAPGPFVFTVHPLSAAGPLTGEFYPTQADRFGNPVPIEWSRHDVIRYTAVKPTGTPLTIYKIHANNDPMAIGRDGTVYGVRPISGFGLVLLAPATDTPGEIDVKIKVMGTHAFSGWVKWVVPVAG